MDSDDRKKMNLKCRLSSKANFQSFLIWKIEMKNEESNDISGTSVWKQVRMYHVHTPKPTHTHTHALLKTTHIEHRKMCENVLEGDSVWVQMNEDRCACDMCGYISLLKVQNRNRKTDWPTQTEIG